MDENEDLIGQISIVCSAVGWHVITHVGYFSCREDADAYVDEILEERDGARLPAATVFH